MPALPLPDRKGLDRIVPAEYPYLLCADCRGGLYGESNQQLHQPNVQVGELRMEKNGDGITDDTHIPDLAQ